MIIEKEKNRKMAVENDAMEGEWTKLDENK